MKKFQSPIIKRIVIVLWLNLLLCPFVLGQTGSHRCITWEKLTASGPDLKQIGWLAARHSKDIESSSWSIGCETLDRDQADFKVYQKYIGELGAKHARLQSGWAKCEKEKGVYDFQWLDDCIYGVKEQGAEPWVCLCYGNPIYGSGKHLAATVGDLANSEEGMAAWLKYVEATVTRYKDVVKTWGIWNEPYYQDRGKEFTPLLKGYTSLLIATAEVVRKAQPDAIILGEIDWQSGNKGTVAMLETLKSNNKLDLVDYWSYHPYKNNPDECYPEVEQLKTLLQSYHPDYKLHQGEAGCPSILEWTHALKRYPWTEYSQAKWNLRRMAGDHVRNIPSSVFTIIDLKYPDMLQSFGLIRSNLLLEFIYKRPSYYAVQHMFGFFDDTVKPVGELEYESDSPRRITVAGFAKADKPVVLIWYSDQIPSDDLKWDKVDLTIKDVRFDDPVYVEMITGKVYEIEKSTWKSSENSTEFTQLPLWDSPVMIAERSQVALRQDNTSAAERKPDIVCGDQAGNRILILDSSMDWRNPDAIRWEWSGVDNPQVKPEHQSWFLAPTEVKCVLDGKCVLMTTAQVAALVRIADHKLLYYVKADGNTHSAVLLPDGNLVTASSTGNYLCVYHIPVDGKVDPEKVYSMKVPMEDAHGVVWDSHANMLRASGMYGITDFRYNFEKETPKLQLVAEHPVFSRNEPFVGHDLYPVRGTQKYYLTGEKEVRIFDPEKGTFEVLSKAERIKSIDSLPAEPCPIVSQPQEQWWTDTVSTLESTSVKPLRTLPGAKFYKVRWFVPDDRSTWPIKSTL